MVCWKLSASVEWLLCTPIEKRANSCRESIPTKAFSNVMRKLDAIRLIVFFLIVLGCLFFIFLTLVLGMEPRTLYRIAELYSCAVTEPFLFFFLFFGCLFLFYLSVRCHLNVFVLYYLCNRLFCFGLFLVELACEYLPRLWVFLGVYVWRQYLAAELLEFLMSHNKPWRSRTRIGSGHLKMFQ